MTESSGSRLPLSLSIMAKELRLFFGSPVAYLFLLAFLGFVLFVFFWGEAFFARNIADVRPLFEWLPVLLIFLSATITMRMWSEERRAGTLEFLLTVPATAWQLVFGKFLSCWALLIIALLLTLPLPVAVSIMGNLDWGPVFAGYLASALLGSTYLAAGLYISARTDNQIVALILAVILCGALYMVGQPLITDLFGYKAADFLRLLGTGARFESITRGLLDVRDLYYYVSLAGVFLILNVHALKAHGWAKTQRYAHNQMRFYVLLAIANLLLANVWLSSLNYLRLDLTEGNRYSISQATRTYLDQLREPLLVRGYFSSNTHPLLAPLGPQLIDLLREYELASGGQVRFELIDPAQSPELEEEANSKYGIQPVPFRVTDRYQASVVKSYFDVLVSYGDQYEVLSFRDLIEIRTQSESDIEVKLRNPEFDITRAIKKAIQNYRSGGDVFDNLQANVQFQGYISENNLLPKLLVETKATLTQVLDKMAVASAGRFTYSMEAPEANGGALAQRIQEDYGFAPMAVDLLSRDRFYFYMTLTDGETLVQVPLPEARSEEGLRQSLQQGLKRFATGLLQQVTLHSPRPVAEHNHGPIPTQAGGKSYLRLATMLRDDFKVQEASELAMESPALDTRVLIMLNSEDLSEQELFWMDQFLMRGGTLVIATSSFDVEMGQELSASPKQTGLEEWLNYHGVTIDSNFVLDAQNARFPVPVNRQVGPFTFREIQMLDYPYFIDLRQQSLNQDIPPLAALPQLTLAWSSAITTDAELNRNRKITPLMTSSDFAWRSESTAITPASDSQGQATFEKADERTAQPLGIMIEGQFESFFEDPPLAPALEETEHGEATEAAEPIEEEPVALSLVGLSPPSARLIVIGSGDFVSDQVLENAATATGTLYTNPLQLIAGLVDWAVEDSVLLSIRNRGHFNRTLPSMTTDDQRYWEYLSYLLSGVGLLVMFLINLQRRWFRQNRQSSWLYEEQA